MLAAQMHFAAQPERSGVAVKTYHPACTSMDLGSTWPWAASSVPAHCFVLAAQVAQFAAELERYSEAIEIYEGVARASVENNLLKYSAKGYLLNAGICQLCSARRDSHVLTSCHLLISFRLGASMCCLAQAEPSDAEAMRLGSKLSLVSAVDPLLQSHFSGLLYALVYVIIHML